MIYLLFFCLKEGLLDYKQSRITEMHVSTEKKIQLLCIVHRFKQTLNGHYHHSLGK